MPSFIEANVRAHVDRLCESDAFRGSPTLCRVLRFLVDKSLESDDSPVGQRLVAEQALGLGEEARTASAVAARMQVGRLRKLLAEHYEGPGAGDPVRIEIPQRNYRLRFRTQDAAQTGASPRGRDRAKLAVVEFAGQGLAASLAWLTSAITNDLLVALSPFHAVEVVGPLEDVSRAAATAGAQGFVVAGDIRIDAAGARVAVRLLNGWDGRQIWADAFGFELASDGTLPPGGPPDLSRVADAIADETGAIACRQIEATAARSPESLSVYEASLACWRFLLTGAPDDMDRGCRATSAARAAASESATAIAIEAWMQLWGYLLNPDPRVRLPGAAVANLERGASLAPGDPWVSLIHAFGLWAVRDHVGPEPICRRLDGQPASGSFRGLMGSLLVLSGIDLARGEALIEEGVRRGPRPLPLFAHALAISRFRQGDLDGMGAALARSAVRTDLLAVVLRMVMACERGDQGFARRLASVAEELVPDCTAAAEVILRRLLHDDHVDALADSLAPLQLAWFV
jgi:TolB-like protein